MTKVAEQGCPEQARDQGAEQRQEYDCVIHGCCVSPSSC
jgi:hypothetical protein